MSIGGGNPIPFEIGGGPTSSMQVYSSLKQMVGIGNSAQDGTIEAAWRMAKARALEAVMDDRRAVLQNWPKTLTDTIPEWEEVFGIPIDESLSDQQRRDQIELRWARQIESAAPQLELQIKSINPDFELFHNDFRYSLTTVPARGFQDHLVGSPDADGPAFVNPGWDNNRKFTNYHNCSTEFICVVKLNLSASPSNEESRQIQQVKDLLNEVLPSWVDFSIFSVVGTLLDQMILDLTAFGS